MQCGITLHKWFSIPKADITLFFLSKYTLSVLGCDADLEETYRRI